MNPTDVSLELLSRYNVQGPRYTSYPTAPVWKESYGAPDYERILIEKGEKSTFQKTKVVAKATADDFAKSFR